MVIEFLNTADSSVPSNTIFALVHNHGYEYITSWPRLFGFLAEQDCGIVHCDASISLVWIYAMCIHLDSSTTWIKTGQHSLLEKRCPLLSAIPVPQRNCPPRRSLLWIICCYHLSIPQQNQTIEREVYRPGVRYLERQIFSVVWFYTHSQTFL